MLLEAGESAALNQLGYFATTNFAKTAFSNRSGGVMPLGNYLYSVWFADTSLRPNYSLPVFNSDFISYNASYKQQGLTAVVTCTTERSSPLDFTTTQSFPNLTSSIITPTITCGNSTSPLPQQVVGSDFLLASSCSLANQTQYVCSFNFLSRHSDLMIWFRSDIFTGIWSIRSQHHRQYTLDCKHDLPT
jgi:hypothetical protein